MSSISSIDTSTYSMLLDGFAEVQRSLGSATTVNSTAKIPALTRDDAYQDVDLSRYYDDITSGDLLQTVSENVVQASNDLSNALLSALENGYTVQYAVNIQQAKCAYEANCRVAKSTFELVI